MAYFVFDAAAVQAADLKELQSVLNRARAISARIVAQNANMTLTQKQAQFGVPAELSEAAWNSTINGVDTALAATSINAFVDQAGFSG